MSVYRLEQDIILHENIGRGLGRYRQHLLKRQQRLPDWMPEVSPTLLTMLDRLDEVEAMFCDLLRGHHPAGDYLAALRQTLAQLGMENSLASDAAGQRILQTLDKMANSAEQVKVKLGWLDFRSWLGRQLERTVGQRLRSEAVINGRTLKEGHPKFARPGLAKLKEKFGEDAGQLLPKEWPEKPVLPEQYRP